MSGQSLSKIDHFFVLMLENRSFDHMLGFSGMSGVDLQGRAATIAGLSGKEAVPADPSVPSSPLISVTPDAELSVNPDPPHEFENVRTQLCGPNGRYPNLTNNGFVASYRNVSSSPERIMRCFSPDRLPVMTALAKNFALCDAWHSGLPGPTWPNRFFVHAATSGGLDASPDTDDTVSAEFLNGYSFKGGTIFTALEAARLSWRVYHGDPLPQVLAIEGMHSRYMEPSRTWFREFEHFREDLQSGDYGPSYTFIEPNYGNVLTSNVTKDFQGGNSQHPVGNVADGEQLIKDVYEALRASPLWERSALIITYDEHGGFFDHVPPPAANPTGDDRRYNQNGFNFELLGVRVPAIIVSPWVPRNVIDSQVRDHSAVLATVEHRFGIKPLTGRDANVAALDDFFCLDAPRQDAPLSLPAPNGASPAAPAPAPQSPDGALDPATESFLHLAGSVSCRVSPEACPAVQGQVKDIDSKDDARDFIKDVAAKLKALKL